MDTLNLSNGEILILGFQSLFETAQEAGVIGKCLGMPPNREGVPPNREAMFHNRDGMVAVCSCSSMKNDDWMMSSQHEK